MSYCLIVVGAICVAVVTHYWGWLRGFKKGRQHGVIPLLWLIGTRTKPTPVVEMLQLWAKTTNDERELLENIVIGDMAYEQELYRDYGRRRHVLKDGLSNPSEN